MAVALHKPTILRPMSLAISYLRSGGSSESGLRKLSNRPIKSSGMVLSVCTWV